MSDPGPGLTGPSLWEVMAADPSIPIDRDTLRLEAGISQERLAADAEMLHAATR